MRKPSAATLTAPFSAIDIADAAAHPDEDTDDPTIKDGSVRRASITKTRTGKPMDSPTKPEDTWKRTRRGGKARRKELAAQQRHNNGTDLTSSPEAVRKGYVHIILLFSFRAKSFKKKFPNDLKSHSTPTITVMLSIN